MKHVILLSLLTASILFTGCGEETKKAATEATAETSKVAEDTKSDLQKAAADAAEATKRAAELTAKLAEEKAAEYKETAADDLTKLSGIGKVGNEKLVEAGFNTFAKIAAMSEEDAATFKVKAEAIAEAKELV